jgi:hypothetical protein
VEKIVPNTAVPIEPPIPRRRAEAGDEHDRAQVSASSQQTSASVEQIAATRG